MATWRAGAGIGMQLIDVLAFWPIFAKPDIPPSQKLFLRNVFRVAPTVAARTPAVRCLVAAPPTRPLYSPLRRPLTFFALPSPPFALSVSNL